MADVMARRVWIIGVGGSVKVKVHKVRFDPELGALSLALGARRALPMEGVLMTLDRRIVEPDKGQDPTLVIWNLPVKTERYIYYGIVTPLARLRLAPRYERMVLQGGRLHGKTKPRVVKTRKKSAVEWIGQPEVLSIIAG